MKNVADGIKTERVKVKVLCLVWIGIADDLFTEKDDVA
jgi:hypothetical protein